MLDVKINICFHLAFLNMCLIVFVLKGLSLNFALNKTDVLSKYAHMKSRHSRGSSRAGGSWIWGSFITWVMKERPHLPKEKKNVICVYLLHIYESWFQVSQNIIIGVINVKTRLYGWLSGKLEQWHPKGWSDEGSMARRQHREPWRGISTEVSSSRSRSWASRLQNCKKYKPTTCGAVRTG